MLLLRWIYFGICYAALKMNYADKHPQIELVVYAELLIQLQIYGSHNVCGLSILWPV